MQHHDLPAELPGWLTRSGFTIHRAESQDYTVQLLHATWGDLPCKLYVYKLYHSYALQILIPQQHDYLQLQVVVEYSNNNIRVVSYLTLAKLLNS